MEPAVQVLITAGAAFLASGAGFWRYLRSQDERRRANTRLLMGLAHEKILYLAFKYEERGWISKDEYQDFQQYLYTPYVELGGNGIAERAMHAIDRLPIKQGYVFDIPIRSTDRTASEEDKKKHDIAQYNGPDRRAQE
jgi:hypothetical protein